MMDQNKDHYESLTPAFDPSDPSPPPVNDPTQIGRYRIIKLLGKGGFGHVYLAQDDDLNRPVAIKVPRPERVSRPQDVEAYLNEARILASLDHAHIVPVYDVGRSEDGLCFVVSKFIEGSDLSNKIKQVRPSFQESASLVATIADALHYAHTRGLVHRDVKPANILIDSSGKPFVADFGLALKDEDFGKGGGIAGTPAYMSPEQARGEGHRVDGRSDIFSLGVVLYELLSGRRPFIAKSQDKGEARIELLDLIATTEPRPPRQIEDTIPKELERICLKALSKRASERYTTARDMADDLRHWLRPSSNALVPFNFGREMDDVAEARSPAKLNVDRVFFVSYASPDKEAAFGLCQLLEDQGIGCWIAPRDVSPGADYGEAIIRAIEGTKATLLLLSTHSNASIHVTHEVERATSKRRRVIPVRLEDVQPSPSLELHLATAQWIDAWRTSSAQMVAQLASVVQIEGGKPTSSIRPADTQPKLSSSDHHVLKIVPKGLRSFDEHDADFFLELLPGPRDRDGLPDNIRFWKRKIEQIDPDLTFKVGLIYGPSGCGKSSMVKAGLLPRLGKHVLIAYVEATAEETEARLLKGLRKTCPELPRELPLVDSLANVRRGRILPHECKVLLVLDQFEQWLHARRGEENSELVAALRHCDGEHVQALVLVRDDFWMAATRFMRGLEIRLIEGENSAAVDLFDLEHARKVLVAFGRAFGRLPEKVSDDSTDQMEFLKESVNGLAEEGKVISVRLALFAEMMKGKPWTPAKLKEVGGTKGVGVTFLEETFSASTAPPEHRIHQKSAQSVLKALLPETSTDIKGQMRSRQELLEASGYTNRPREFDDLIHILDPELRLITPTDPDGSSSEGQQTRPSGQYYQLAHDYLVHSLRNWLTRKQTETRRGRAELRLGERSSLWNAKPENRHLPSVLEWANVRLLTRKKDWTDPQRTMMKRAGRVHGVRGFLTFVLLSAGLLAGFAVRRQVIETQRANYATGLVQRVLDAETQQVPDIVVAMRDYRQLVGPSLRSEMDKRSDDSRQKLHASLALLPVDATQVDYLFSRLLSATPSELPVLRDALKIHQSILTPRLWTALESAKPSDANLLPSACALASYDPESARWEAVVGKVAQELVSVNAIQLGPWIEALRPVRGKLTAPLAMIFKKKERPESEHKQATNILADYASDHPDRLAELLMVADPKAYLTLFPVAKKRSEQVLPILQDEIVKKATSVWNDSPLARSWAKPDAALVSRIESAQGLFSERFASCQTMPLGEFLTTAEALGKAGYRPMRFRPYSDGGTVRVAAVWTRDGRNWRISSGMTAEEVRKEDDRNKKDKFISVDVAGYVSTDAGAKSSDRYAAVWVEKSGDDDAQLYVGITALEQDQIHDKLKDANLIPRTLHAMIGYEGRTKYCGVWGKPPGAGVTGQAYRDQFEGNFEQTQASLGDQLLLDVVVSGASKPQPTRERAQADLQSAEKKLKIKPADLDARLARATANLRLGENQKALDDFQVVIGKNQEAVVVKQYKVVALARLGKKQDAQSELAKYQKEEAPESSKLYLAAVVAAELGEGTDKAFESLEAAIKKQPKDADLRYDAARAFSLASNAVSRSDKAKGRQLAERSLQLLREAVRNDDADFGKMDEDADLDPIRDDPAFAEIIKANYPDRRYAAIWNSNVGFEATSLYGLDPAAQLQESRNLIAQGYRPVSWSVSQTGNEGKPVTASVWHRPVITEETRDRLAERQARAAIALVRMGDAGDVWTLLRHSSDPRLRSFIVNWLKPLDADPKRIAAELDRIDPNTKPTSAQAQQKMDAILFHPETSMRRALILALGTYGEDGLSLGEREPLIGKLLALYRNDPDAGIHGAAEWTLRKWGQQDKLKEVEADLMKIREWGERRWFVNSQGQTFAVIEGPVEYRMGSPPSDTERTPGNEPPMRMQIPRRFAIAAKEVTIEQFQRFLKLGGITIDRYQVSPSFLAKFSPDSEGPWIGPDWYTAAHYCNWLSEQEGLPKEQWCYLPNESGSYAEGMSIPADALERTGYRLPTEAEWEYGCRSGADTSRYYGHSIELLGAYAWYQANSKEHAWRCGSLIPNDLGMFDMLGNDFEWVQDSIRRKMPERKGLYIDHIYMYTIVIEKDPRLVRGGAFVDQPAFVRSALRGRYAPSGRSANFGFRPSRTYH